MGMALILALYLTRKDRTAQCIAGAVFTLFEPVAPLAFGLVWFYSGERGSCSRARTVGVLLVLPRPSFPPRVSSRTSCFSKSKELFSQALHLRSRKRFLTENYKKLTQNYNMKMRETGTPF